jgi:hypothetical protein
MDMKKVLILSIVVGCCLLTPTVLAHVPYLERTDFSMTSPFVVHKSIRQSKGVYAWLETDFIHPCSDVDVYQFTLRRPSRVHLEVIVPVCGGFFANFTPWFALVGPGLPSSNQTLPFEVPEGDGVIVLQDAPPGSQRQQFYEPFGGKWYYQGPVYDEHINTTGIFFVYYWDPYAKGGDYSAVLGYREIFYPSDIVRSLINVPIIRHNGELHVPSIVGGL